MSDAHDPRRTRLLEQVAVAPDRVLEQLRLLARHVPPLVVERPPPPRAPGPAARAQPEDAGVVR